VFNFERWPMDACFSNEATQYLVETCLYRGAAARRITCCGAASIRMGGTGWTIRANIGFRAPRRGS